MALRFKLFFGSIAMSFIWFALAVAALLYPRGVYKMIEREIVWMKLLQKKPANPPKGVDRESLTR